ncbi:EIN3-binding F-box protein 1-like [Primulina huaijiensis]|uniref:EIN3-binding F-box protein 1-like n=1 Tax=Primulina huaijiensis TaxID=1492673 RepID=UPI003CC742B7
MSKVFDFSGVDDFCSGGFMHTNPKDSNLFFPLGHHADVYFPRKRSRVSAPFVFSGEVKPQPSIEVLPDACLFEVFRRLSVGQERSACASVSKRWLMLLSSIHRDEILPAKGNLGPDEHDNTSISVKADEAFKPKEKVEFVDSSVVKSVNEEFEGIDSDGFLSRCLEGKKATDVRLASIAVGTGSRGGLGKLSIRGSSSTRGLTNLGLRAIGRGCPSLRYISLWNLSSISDEGLLEIASGARLLEKLDLCHCPAITDIGLIAIAMNCPNLISVTIESCTNIGNESLKGLGRYCPNLKCITVKNCALIGDQGIVSLFSSAGHVLSKAKFQALDISDVSLAVIGHYGSAMTDLALLDLQNVNDRGFWVMGKGQGLQKLEVLSITACRGVSDSGLEALGDGCPNLKLFGLRKNLLVSDTGIVKLARAAVSLESLQLEECHRITQCGVFHILANCGGKFKALALANCLGIRDINFQFPLTSICCSLRSLIIHNCPGFGDVGLAVLGKMCPKLTQVELSGLQGITDTGLLPLICSLEAGLNKLNLSGSVNLTDNSVVAITKLHGETLELMNIDGCKYLTDITLSEIAQNCSVLTELDVSKCGITDSGIATLAGAEQLHLQIFSLAGCSFVSDKSLPYLGVLGKTLLGLNIRHCNGISSSSIDLLLEQLWRCDVLY